MALERVPGRLVAAMAPTELRVGNVAAVAIGEAEIVLARMEEAVELVLWLAAQQGEVAIAVEALSHMIQATLSSRHVMHGERRDLYHLVRLHAPTLLSFDAGADVDLGHAVGIAGEAHFVAGQFFQETEPPHAGFLKEAFRRHYREADIPDPHRPVE